MFLIHPKYINELIYSVMIILQWKEAYIHIIIIQLNMKVYKSSWYMLQQHANYSVRFKVAMRATYSMVHVSITAYWMPEHLLKASLMAQQSSPSFQVVLSPKQQAK